MAILCFQALVKFRTRVSDETKLIDRQACSAVYLRFGFILTWFGIKRDNVTRRLRHILKLWNAFFHTYIIMFLYNTIVMQKA